VLVSLYTCPSTDIVHKMSTFTNSYKAPAASFPENVHLDTAEADYDYNFMFEPKTLQSDRVVLRPFLVSWNDLRLGYDSVPLVRN
jgi:hypothetical protein